MRSLKRFGRILVIALLLTFLISIPVLAQTPTPIATETAPPVNFSTLVAELLGMAGFSGAVTLLINIFKSVGWVKDGQAPTYSAVVNFIGLGVLLAVRMFRPDVDVGAVDKQIGDFVSVGVVIFAYVVQLAAGKGTHAAAAGIPILGKSFTAERQALMEKSTSTTMGVAPVTLTDQPDLPMKPRL